MAGRPLYARLGLGIRPEGSSADLAVAIGGMELDAANRIGFYADTAPAAEQIGIVVGGTEVGRFHNDILGTAFETLGPLAVAGTVRAADGTAVAPSYGFSTDPNTGMYSAGPDSLGFAVNGANMLVVDSAGLTISADLVAEFGIFNQDVDISGVLNAVGGINTQGAPVRTAQGSVSVDTGVTTTIYTATPGGVYLIEVHADDGSAIHGTVMVYRSNVVGTLESTGLTAIVMSGNDFQIEQTSGITHTMHYSVLRIRE